MPQLSHPMLTTLHLAHHTAAPAGRDLFDVYLENLDRGPQCIAPARTPGGLAQRHALACAHFFALDAAAADQSVEIARLGRRGRVLVQQRQVALVKFLEPLIPRDVLERLRARVARE